MEKKKGSPETGQVSASFKVGAIAFVFLIIGYQAALFVFRAGVVGITEHRDRPDTVYVIDKAMAGELLSAGLDVEADADSMPVIIRQASTHSKTAEAISQRYSRKAPESFRFNPNTVTVADLQRLGFSAKQAEAIDNYRMKGGRFHRKADFARSFVVSDSVFKRLEPFIEIPPVDINKADSAAFDALPGIGPFFASKMVSYREMLHGYSYAEQLMDIWKFDREKYDGLKDLITLSSPEPYPLWTLPEDSLRLHPYIKGAAHGVVLYRENTPGADWSVAGLHDAGILDDVQASKLGRCIIAEH